MVSKKETWPPPIPKESLLGFRSEVIKSNPILNRYVRVANSQQHVAPENKVKLVLFAVFCRLGRNEEGELIESSNNMLSVEDITDLLGVSKKEVRDSQTFLYTPAGLDLWQKYEDALNKEGGRKKMKAF